MQSNLTCIVVDDEPKNAELFVDTLAELQEDVDVVGVYHEWKAALDAIKSKKPNVLFMDISMPGKTGFELLELIPDLESEIIFVTAHSEYALDAFNFDVCDYLLKPVGHKALLKSVKRAIARQTQKGKLVQKNEGIVLRKVGVPDDFGVKYVNIDDIIYIETIKRYTRVVCRDEELLSSYNIGKYNETLDHDVFFQVHRSFIVNLTYVERYNSEGLIVMKSGSEIPLSKSQKEEFLKKFERVGK